MLSKEFGSYPEWDRELLKCLWSTGMIPIYSLIKILKVAKGTHDCSNPGEDDEDPNQRAISGGTARWSDSRYIL